MMCVAWSVADERRIAGVCRRVWDFVLWIFGACPFEGG
jgi:hypothetical protein